MVEGQASKSRPEKMSVLDGEGFPETPIPVQTVASKQLGFNSVQVVAVSAAVSPISLTPFWACKVVDANGELHEVVFDKDGTLFDDKLAAELVLSRFEGGNIHPDLASAAALATDQELIPIIIWCRVEELPMAPRINPEGKLDELLMAKAVPMPLAFDQLPQIVRVTEKLEQFAADIRVADDAPMVFATVPKSRIEEIAGMAETQDVYLNGFSEPMLNIARQVSRAHTVNSRGVDGRGIKVGVIEVGGKVSTQNPFLSGVVQYEPNSCLANHAALVAGVVGGRHSIHRGIAPGSSLFVGGSCSGSESELQLATTAARNWGARVVNNSWGYLSPSRVPNAMARYLDSQSWQYSQTIVQAAGNTGRYWQNVINPAQFYNGIAVGAFDDRGTVTVNDDAMADF